ncbi:MULTISPECIES: glutaminase A [Peptoniphilus]|uniref:glutaminase A n=1 Tax=Peptoniphilus TaxID=162289 RepID=UPI000287B9C0|nr:MULTISPECIES: glutaminase A [Peptoniphilus]MBS6610458.1 glutaminase A [Peptoniphilus harei]MDU1954838.1 glutaminase A [Peptoniphilus lacydonensis]MDU2114791.1 glutaminase A [Peptoniphilus lacydonensis]MDU5274356.1 glutaminase A [Peptoniphilus lacydonensis]MDU5377424.1 glutaminase A [Peptoniphilus lacydonensis]
MFLKKEKVIEKIEQSIKKSEKFCGEGELATYIPELANVDPDGFALSIVTTAGNVYNFGEVDTRFSMQSISKIISLIMALNDNTIHDVFEKVGTEPTKYKFNSLIPIDDKPSNPLINAGAITTASLIVGKDVDEKFERVLNMVKKLSDSEKIKFLEEIYSSEMETTDVNRSIAYYLRSKKIFSLDAEEVLDLYIRNCSIGINATELAHLGAVLANGGADLVTGDEMISRETVKIVLAQMASCGMYEESGEFLLNVGIPSKSGVSGAILGIVPGKCGICTYSPRLDESGNSVRGKNLLKILSKDLNLNIFL